MDDDLEAVGPVGSHGRQIGEATAAAPVELQGDAVALSLDLGGLLRIRL
jgi:hypothetical protein